MSNEIPTHDSLLDDPLHRFGDDADWTTNDWTADPDEEADDPCNNEEGND